MEKKEIDMVMVGQVVSMLLIVHAVYLLLGLEMIFMFRRIYLLLSGLPIVFSSVCLLFFALHVIMRKKLILRLLMASACLSWAGCLGWFVCQRLFERYSDWQVFYSPVFWFPIFLVIFFTRQKIKKQFSLGYTRTPAAAPA